MSDQISTSRCRVRGRTRGRRVGITLALVGLAAAVFATLGGAQQGDAASAAVPVRAMPAEDVSAGMRYDGLEFPAAGAACDTAKLYITVKTNACTHGPDEAPTGVDVRISAAPLSAKVAQATPAITCDGDGISGYRTEVLYVRETGDADRYNTYAASIRTWASGADDIYNSSAVETGGSRRIRFVHTTPGCEIIVRNVVVPNGANDSFDGTINAVSTLGYNRTDRKYMMFVDANVYCGIGNINADDQPGQSNLNNFGPEWGRSDAGCWNATVPAHEHNHNIGGVQLSAPNTSLGWHCVDEWDNMCYSDSPNFPTMQYLCTDSAHDSRFDCNHDDYFHTNPAGGSYLATHWNTANSRYLIGGGSCIPGNDAFANRITLTGVTTGNTACATGETGEDSLYAPLNSVWYNWTAPATGSASFTTCDSETNFNTAVSVYTGNAVASLTRIAQNDNDSACANTNQSTATIAATQGAQYRVRVDGYQGQTGNFRLRAVCGAANDAFAAAVNLGAVTRTVANNTCATGETNEPGGSGTLNTMWYRWTAPASGTATFSTCDASTSFDTFLNVFTGSAVGSLTSVVTNDDAPCAHNGLHSVVRTSVTQNTVYRIRVDGYNSNVGQFALRVGLNAPGAPAVTNAVAGNGWVIVSWNAPVNTGGSPITEYMILGSNGGAGTTNVAPATARRAVLPITNGQGYQFTVISQNTSGPSLSSAPSSSVTGSTATLSVSTKYDSAARARLLQSAAYYGLSATQFQHDAVAGVAFIFGLGPAVIRPVTPPNLTTGTTYTSTYAGSDQGPLVTVARRLALTPSEAQHASTSLIGYLLALGGH